MFLWYFNLRHSANGEGTMDFYLETHLQAETMQVPGYFQPAIIQNRAHTHQDIGADNVGVNTSQFYSEGCQAGENNGSVGWLRRSKWNPHNGFQVEDLEHNHFKIIFQNVEGHNKSKGSRLVVDWMWSHNNFTTLCSGYYRWNDSSLDCLLRAKGWLLHWWICRPSCEYSRDPY